MTDLNKLIDKAAGMCSPPNDSALAKRMHLSRSAVSLWRQGGVITEKHLTALVTLADVDEATAVEILKAQAKTPAQKKVWEVVLKRLATTAAAVILTCSFALQSQAKPLPINGFHAPTAYSLHIMSNATKAARWIWQLIKLWLSSHFPRKDSGPSMEACL